MKGTLNVKDRFVLATSLALCLGLMLPSLGTGVFAAPPAFSGVHLSLQDMPKAAPAYSSSQQAIFWTSGDANPGDTVLVSGAFTSTAKTVQVAVISPGTADWKQGFKQAGVTAQVHSADASSISFTIPSQLPKGVYAFRIGDESSIALYGEVNLPKIYWTLGMNQQLAPSSVEGGKALRIFGTDFPDSARVFLVSGVKKVSLSPRQQDGNAIEVDIPQSLAAGNYSLQIGSGAAPDSTASAPVSLQITRPGSYSLPPSKVVSCPGIGVGKDVTAILQACLDSNTSAGNSVYFKIPPGDYLISGSISLHSHQYLQGAGADKTTITGNSTNIPQAWVVGTSYFGLSDLTIQGGMVESIISSKDAFSTDETLIGDPTSAGHIFLSGLHVVISRLPTPTRVAVNAVSVSGPDIRIENTVIDNTRINKDTSPHSAPNVVLNVVRGNGVVISGSQVKLGEGGQGASFISSQNVVFENNVVAAAEDVKSGVCGTGIGRGKLGASGNFFIASNTYRGIKDNAHEGITTDGYGGVFLGHVQTVSGTQLTLADDPNWSLSAGHTDGFLVSIIAGTGMGQYRLINGVNGRILQLDKPWDLAPDQTSVAEVTPYERHLVVVRNTVSDFEPGIQFYGMTFDSLIKDNQLQDTSGIHLLSLFYSSGTGLPVMDIQVTGNRISGRPDNLTDKDVSGIVFKNIGGFSFTSGVLIRNNQIDSVSAIFTDQTGDRPPQNVLFDKNNGAYSKATLSDHKASILLR